MAATSNITETSIGSVSDLIEEVAAQYTGNDDVLFRGQSDESWTLTPRLGRLNLRGKFKGSLLEVEKRLLDDFARFAVPHLGNRTMHSTWDLLALGQHHGLPTRLLDWSSNPLVALWFAVERPPKDGRNAVVWALKTLEPDFADLQTNPLDVPRTLLFRPRHHDTRIVAQAGWFSVHKPAPSTKKFSNFENLKAQKQRLRKLIIAPICFPAIREDLARCGIIRAALFPGLAGLCEHLTWKYEKLSDEDEYDAIGGL